MSPALLHALITLSGAQPLARRRACGGTLGLIGRLTRRLSCRVGGTEVHHDFLPTQGRAGADESIKELLAAVDEVVRLPVGERIDRPRWVAAGVIVWRKHLQSGWQEICAVQDDGEFLVVGSILP